MEITFEQLHERAIDLQRRTASMTPDEAVFAILDALNKTLRDGRDEAIEMLENELLHKGQR